MRADAGRLGLASVNPSIYDALSGEKLAVSDGNLLVPFQKLGLRIIVWE